MFRSLCLFAILTIFSSIHLNAQAWEVVCEQNLDCPQGFDDGDAIANIEAYQFNFAAAFGATGAIGDHAAYSLNTENAYLSFLHAQLEPDYEYRLSINAKCEAAGAVLDFAWRSASGGSMAISSNHAVAELQRHLAGVDVVSEVFSVPALSDYYMIISPRGANGTATVIVDEYRLERRALVQTELNLSAANITVNEGQAVEFCVDISAVGANTQGQAQLNLVHGEGNHFDAYTSHVFNIDANSAAQECVSIPTQYANQTAQYKFELVLVGNNNTIEIGEHSGVFVTVNAVSLEEECDWAGPDVSICQGGEGATIGNPDLQSNDNELCWDTESYCVKWEPSTGLDDPSSLMPLANPTQSTTYTIYVTDNNGNLYGQDEVFVEVLPVYAPSISPVTTVLCGEGDELLLSAFVPGNADDYTFTWSDAAQTTGTQLSVNEVGAYTVTLYDPATGCSRTTETLVEQRDLAVIIGAEETEICEGQEIVLEAILADVEDPAAFNYLWSNGQTTASIQVASAGLYELTVTDPLTDCRAYAELQLYPKEISVEILVANVSQDNNIFDVSPIPEMQPFCSGKSFNLGVVGNYTEIEWSDSDNLIVVNGGEQAIYTPSEGVITETISVTVTDAGGCTATDEVIFEHIDEGGAALASFIDQTGFYCIDIEVLGEETAVLNSNTQALSVNNDPCASSDCNENVCVKGNANLNIKVEGEEIGSLHDFVKSTLQYFVSEYGYPSAKAYISYSEDVCACNEQGFDYLTETETQFNADELAYWIFISESASADEPDKMCVLANVPTSQEHFPLQQTRRDLLDFTIDYATTDNTTGGFANEGEQVTFTLLHNLLDNLLQETPGETPQTPHLCDGALYEEPPIILAPSGIPLELPANVSLSWIPTFYWVSKASPGSLVGFTHWVEDNKPVYYSARVDMDFFDSTTGSELPILPYFNGYYQYTTRRDIYEGSVYTSQMPNSNVIEVGLVEDWNEDSYLVRSYNAIYHGDENTYSSSNGAGSFYVPSFFEPQNPQNPNSSALATLTVGPSELIYTVADGDITGAECTEQIEYNGLQASVFRLTYTDEEGNEQYEFVLATYENGELNVYLFDCHSGGYDIPLDLEDLPSSVLIEINSITAANRNMHEEEELLVLGASNCFYFTPEQAANLGAVYTEGSVWEEGEEDRVKNYANIGAEMQNLLKDEADRVNGAGDGDLFLQFVLSADQELVDRPVYPRSSGPSPDPYGEFVNGLMSRVNGSFNTPGVKIFVHFGLHGDVHICMRFAEDFYSEYTKDDGTHVNVSEEEARKLQSMAFTKLRDALELKANTNELDESIDDCAPYDECESEQEALRRPWMIGKRNPNQELNFANLAGELSAIGADFMKDGELSPEITYSHYPENHPNNANEEITSFLFEAPEVGVAFANKIVAENPIVGLYQLGTFGWSMFNDANTRQAIVNALKEPKKVARAMYKDKVGAYTGNNKELMLWHAGADAGAIVAFFWGGSAATVARMAEKVKGLGKRADDSARKLSDELPAEGNNYSAIEDDPHFVDIEQQFSADGLDGFTNADIEEFWRYLGDENRFSAIDKKKFMYNPSLAKWWKRFKNDPDFCTFTVGGLQAPPNNGTASTTGTLASFFTADCPDFDVFIKQMPDPPSPVLKAKMKEVFTDFDTPAGQQKAEDFIRDVQNPENGSQLFEEIGMRPELLEAWDVLDDAGTALKTNIIALKKIDFLKSEGFSNVNLKILGEADDMNVLKFAEGFVVRNLGETTVMARHSKMMEIKGLSGAPEFLKYQEDINKLIIIKDVNGNFLLQNPDGLSNKISAMNTSGNGNVTNPFQIGGHDFEIEWALDIANQGKSVRLDELNLPDVLDDVGEHAYHLKKINGPGVGVNKIGTFAEDAVSQFKPSAEPAPLNYSKNVVIKNNNPNNPHYNASKQDLIEYLQGYNQNSGTSQFPGPSGTLNGMDKFIIKNNIGTHEILGSVIDI